MKFAGRKPVTLTDDQLHQIAAWKTEGVQNREIARRLRVTQRVIDSACNTSPILENWRAYEPTKKRKSPGPKPPPKPIEERRYNRPLSGAEVEKIVRWRAEGVPGAEMARRLHRTWRKLDELIGSDPRLSPDDEPPAKPLTGRMRKRLTQHQISYVRKWTSQGFSVTAIANKLNMARETLKKLIDTDPAVKEAIEVGRDEEERGLVDILKDQAAKGNVIAPIFLLKSRHAYRDSTPVVVNDNSDRRTQVLNMPAAASLDQFTKLIESFKQSGNRLPGTFDPADDEPLDRQPADDIPVLRNLRQKRHE